MTKTEENSNRLAAVFMLLALAFLGVLALTSCQGAIDEVQKGVTAIEQLWRDGVITHDQYIGLRDALLRSDWDSALRMAGEVGASVLFALTGVRLWRGGIDTRKGKLPENQA